MAEIKKNETKKESIWEKIAKYLPRSLFFPYY